MVCLWSVCIESFCSLGKNFFLSGLLPSFVRRSFLVGLESQTVSFTSSNKPGLSTAGGGWGIGGGEGENLDFPHSRGSGELI